MTMEDRTAALERGAPTASTISSNTFCDDGSCDASYPLQRATKRTFDVAFLVAPDENLVRRQSEKLRLVSTDRLTELRKDHSDDAEKLPQNLTIKHYESQRKRSQDSDTYSRTLPDLSPNARRYRSQKSSSPHFPQGRCVDIVEPIGLTCTESRSAFTKVSIQGAPRSGGFDDGQTSPRSSISPDRASYQSSVSPPVLPLTPNYKYAFPTKMTYPFLMGPESQQAHLLENLKIPQPPRIPSPKLTFRPELPQYPNLSYNPISVFPPMPDALARPRFLATGLIPPSLAALTLPAQNVCAKCNLSFRMTSDLVYHMRSHHKNETASEVARRRREEKLRCPVCDESFRERHHLTRHMTAHQDKESDAIVDQVEVKRRTAPIHGK